jgi:hypothetical protein
MVTDKRSVLRRWTAAYAALLVAAFSSPNAAQQDDEEEVTSRSRAPRSCLPHPTIDRTKILNDRTIVFVTRDDTIYQNELPKQCPGLKRNSLVNYGIANGRMCAGDRFQILWEIRPGNYQPAAVCALGSFRPISATELEDLVAMTEENREMRRRGRSSREAVTTREVELPRREDVPAAAEAAPVE